MRTLELYPSVGFQLTPQIKLAFWSEYGMSMNAQTGKWFVPADAMVTYSFSKTWAGSVGASAPIVKDNLLYFWNAYGRVVYNF